MDLLEIWIHHAAVFVELLAVVLMVGFIVVGSVRWIFSANRFSENT